MVIRVRVALFPHDAHLDVMLRTASGGITFLLWKAITFHAVCSSGRCSVREQRETC